MSKPPSEKTQIRNLQRELRISSDEVYKLRGDVRELTIRCEALLKDRDEWKRRFDILMNKDQPQ